MEDPSRTVLHDFHMASRKAEEAALRRFQAAVWLENFVGPLGLSTQPTEREFVSCLRSGLVLCNAINKIQPRAVPKVIGSHSLSLATETHQLNAYQYFENIRNFLVAVEQLNLPAFEASDLERDSLEAGSTAKIVDCILALKSYHEWKQWSGGVNGSYKHARSPIVPHYAARTPLPVAPVESVGPCRQLDMSMPPINTDSGKLEDSIVEVLTENLLATKENMDHNILKSFRSGNVDSMKLFSEIVQSCLREKQLNHIPELKSNHDDRLLEENKAASVLTESSSRIGNNKSCKSCLKKAHCKHWRLVEVQENDLSDLKVLLSRTKSDFTILQSQMQEDLQQLGAKVQDLSFAALGYQRVIKENRILYNMIQDLKGNIRVYCRIRPLFGTDRNSAIDHIGDDGTLVMVDPLRRHKDARKVFQFNRVFGPTATQEEVFKDTQPLIRSVVDGYNVCIFAYGQTGSGKTHTMCGPSGGSAKDMGINYLALNDLFDISCVRKDTVNYEFQVQMVEIYNEQVRDLLMEDSSVTKLEIRNCTINGGLSVPDARMHVVKSSMDVLNLMELGQMNRVISSTAINNRSSRSHSILTVHVRGNDTSGNILRSCLHLVDLAGSERVDKSEVTGDRLKEAQYINKSLSCLGDVIMALAQKNSHIPYRNSKLTQLLQDSLGGGHAKTLMFAHVSPELESYGETVSTLKFAQRVSTVELGAARINKESNEVNELRAQIESLKKALSSKEALGLQSNKAKEVRSPQENGKLTTEQTPPRPHRMNIESSAIPRTADTLQSNKAKEAKSPREKAKEKIERTPPRSRRLSMEDTVVSKTKGTLKSSKAKELRSPQEKLKVMAERTPPRLRRLSIETSGIVKTEKLMNSDNRTSSKVRAVTEKLRKERTPTRARRLSLEGPKYRKDQLQITSENFSVNVTNGVEVHHYISLPSEQIEDRHSDCRQLQNAEASFSINVEPMTEVNNQHAPVSPTSSVCQSRSVGTEKRMRGRPVQQPKTPEHPRLAEEDQIVAPCDLDYSNKSKTPGFSSKKGSQIRKSLRTIGKLINGSDRRNQEYPAVTKSSINGTSNSIDKSPLSVNGRALRRQSLTGVQTSRRSSLGGNSTEKIF